MRGMRERVGTQRTPVLYKVRIALAEKKFEYALVVDSPWVAGNAVAYLNPLGKIPMLVLDDGTRLFDSRVIVEYLDTVSRLIPEPSRQRIAVKRWEALADGICEAASAVFLERKRPLRQQSKDWIVRQRAKIDRGVVELAEEQARRAPELCGHPAARRLTGGPGPRLSAGRRKPPLLQWFSKVRVD
jgi:glutathione S-transferase